MRRHTWSGLSVLAGPAVLALALLASPATARNAWLGVTLQSVDDDLREALDLASGGVLVSDVADGSPAEDAGLEGGDVILEIDGRAVDAPDGVVRAVRRADPGDVLAVRINRDGDTRTIEVTLAERDDDEPMARLRKIDPHIYMVNPRRGPRGADPEALLRLGDFFSRPRLGVETRKMDGDLAGYFGVDEDEGVLVLEVMADTPAEEAGMKAGDVILSIDGQPVRSPGELRDLLLEHEGDSVTIEIRRHGSDQTLEIELDSPDAHWSMPGGAHLGILGDDRDDLQEELDRLREEVEALREELHRGGEKP